MGKRIDKLEWMAPETKVKAHAKLAAFTPKIGYPSQLAATIPRCGSIKGDAFGNALARARMGFERRYRQARRSRSGAGSGA
jgi:putative endopeptidase